ARQVFVKRSERLILLVAEGFGLGRLPKAPGTYGSLWGLLIGWMFDRFCIPVEGRLVIWLAMFVLGIPICRIGAAARGRKDPGSVVWDEMAAFPLVYLMVRPNFPSLVAGYALFRLFDISKPWPIRRFERIPGGMGIMIDDQIAGVFAMLCLTGMTSLWSLFE
ncbi:MAG: phosphatidylglycerophosphatase A, partial [Planctomycetaceae bacterium]|nr:phosphatidylglycerophosphatase A [Planctomycetaceae bacterium]